MYSKSIGIIGGFGAYATLHFYQRILEVFYSDCERDYPHIYMDNDFTMPSRTRALLYGEEYDKVVAMIANSLKKMCLLEADYIILACGTAHAFLPEAINMVPEAKGRIINLINLLGKELKGTNCKQALLIAAEGTLENKVYESFISKEITIINPGQDNYGEIRYFIEAVKKNHIGDETYNRWMFFLDKFNEKNVILGCTEFPMLIEKVKCYDEEKRLSHFVFYDPLEIVINELKKSKMEIKII